MIAPEADPDVVRWGLNLLYGDDSNMNHGINNIQLNVATPYHGNYATAPQFPTEPSNVESDEMIAYTLQQDELAVEPVAGSQHSEEQNGAVLTDDDIPCQQFCEQGARHSENQEESSHENEDDNCCSSSDGSDDDNDEACTSLDLLEESSVLDGEVGKRLTHLNSVPHVPRTNRDIPSIDEVTSDHQRLLDRLQLYDLTEIKIHGDGNCQFRALCDQFYRTPEHHKFVREQVVNQLKSNPELYQEYVPMPYDEYLKKIAKNGEWGDHVTLQAAADCYGVKICVVTSFKDTCFIEILPNIQHSKRVIFLSFWAEVHYNSIYPDGDVPDFSETKRKKRWWSFGSKN